MRRIFLCTNSSDCWFLIELICTVLYRRCKLLIPLKLESIPCIVNPYLPSYLERIGWEVHQTWSICIPARTLRTSPPGTAGLPVPPPHVLFACFISHFSARYVAQARNCCCTLCIRTCSLAQFTVNNFQ